MFPPGSSTGKTTLAASRTPFPTWFCCAENDQRLAVGGYPSLTRWASCWRTRKGGARELIAVAHMDRVAMVFSPVGHVCAEIPVLERRWFLRPQSWPVPSAGDVVPMQPV